MVIDSIAQGVPGTLQCSQRNQQRAMGVGMRAYAAPTQGRPQSQAGMLFGIWYLLQDCNGKNKRKPGFHQFGSIRSVKTIVFTSSAVVAIRVFLVCMRGPF